MDVIMDVATDVAYIKPKSLIDYRAGSCDYFKPICSHRPYMGSFNNFVEEGDCSTYKTSRIA